MQFLYEQSMRVTEPQRQTAEFAAVSDDRVPFAVAAILSFGGGILVAVMLGLLQSESVSLERLYLLPGILLVLLVTSAPSVVLIIRRRFQLYHPLVLASLFYFLPVFVVGSSNLLGGQYDSWILYLVPDPRHYLSLTLAYVAIGFAGLSLGFVIPIGRRVGSGLSKRLPRWNWRTDDLVKPCLLMLLIGQVFGLLAYSYGSFGYQNAVSMFGTLFLSFFSLYELAAFLLWFAIFRVSSLKPRHRLIAILLIGTTLFTAVMSGSKGGLFTGTVSIVMAYFLAGRRVRLRQLALIVLFLATTLLLGTIFGEEFRLQKSEQQSLELGEYLDVVGSSMESVARQDLGKNIGRASQVVMRRLENLSSLAVIVSNYEALRPLEAQYGLDSNIWTYTWTAFIPRFLWPEKPLIADARSVGSLYFQVSTNSFVMTPMGDLLRNFGPVGVPLGMAVLGVLLRIIFSALIEDQPITAWRAGAYILLVSSVSYEGFYGTILPGMMREGLVITVGFLFVSSWVNRHKRISNEWTVE